VWSWIGSSVEQLLYIYVCAWYHEAEFIGDSKILHTHTHQRNDNRADIPDVRIHFRVKCEIMCMVSWGRICGILTPYTYYTDNWDRIPQGGALLSCETGGGRLWRARRSARAWKNGRMAARHTREIASCCSSATWPAKREEEGERGRERERGRETLLLFWFFYGRTAARHTREIAHCYPSILWPGKNCLHVAVWAVEMIYWAAS